jgi:hypothetical protein
MNNRQPLFMLGLLTVIALVQLLELVTHDDVLAAVVTLVICGSYIAWYLWKNRFH